MKNLFVLCMTLGCMIMHPSLAFAQGSLREHGLEVFKIQLDEAVNDADRENVQVAISQIEGFTNDDLVGHYAHYYLAYAWYRLYNFSTDESEKTKPEYLNHSIKHAKKAIDLMPDFVEAQIVLGNAYGVKAEKSFISGVRFGNKAKNLFEKALKIDPTNPRAAMFVGVGTMFKPMVLGGSAKKAIEEFMKAALLFESFMPVNALTPNWGHAEVYAWLGQAYEQTGEYEKGIEAYEKALTIHPGYRWVRDLLLPQLREKISG